MHTACKVTFAIIIIRDLIKLMATNNRTSLQYNVLLLLANGVLPMGTRSASVVSGKWAGTGAGLVDVTENMTDVTF